MKRVLIILFFVIGAMTNSLRSYAQAQEIEQLLLNVEKLNQLRQILQSMYDGYRILSEAYVKIKNVTSGNYRLHQVFLDGLFLVNPEIKKYKRVADIIEYQLRIVQEYKDALKFFKANNLFSDERIKYLESIYKKLFDDSVQSLDELIIVISSSNLRMSDYERINSIDRIFENMKEKLIFLRSFNQQNKLLGLQNLKEKAEIETLKGLHDLK